jgi:thiamine biosynthesis lipoprotein
MDTVVTIDLVDRDHACDPKECQAQLARAFGWFQQVEACCSRFDSASELSRLSTRIGEPVPVSPVLFQAVRLALAVAADTHGAFDPTVGRLMELRGFDRHYRTGRTVATDVGERGDTVSYRDVAIDETAQTITLGRPLLLDLGAVAKGLAIDMAAHELRAWPDFAINAGGDIYVAGRNPRGEPWSVGIRHPRDVDRLIASVHVSDTAVCSSGDYVRRSPRASGDHHLLDPRSGASADRVASTTVLAPAAMLADAMATAAFVLGPDDGLVLLERHGLQGLVVLPSLEQRSTPGFTVDATILPHAQRSAHHRPGHPDDGGDGAFGRQPHRDRPA